MQGFSGLPVNYTNEMLQLGLKYVDLYLIHFPRVVRGEFEGIWRHYETFKAQGLVKYGRFLFG